MKKEKVDAIINKLYDIQKRGNDNKKNIVELEKEKIILKKEIEELNEKRNILISEIKIKTAEVIEQEATLRIPVRIYMQNLKLFEQNLLGELEKKKLLVEKDRLEKDIDVKDKNIKKVKKKQKDLLELESLINKKVNLGVNKEKIIISLEKEEIKIKKEKEELEKEIIKEKEVLLHRLHPKALQEKKNKKNAIGLMLSINLKENCKDIKKIKPKELEKISNWIGAKISKKVYGNILLYKDLSKKEYLEIKDSTEKHLVFILNKNTVEELKDLSKRVGNEVDVINMLKYLEYVKKNQSIKKKIKDK
jgi:chromosome segregation protein